MEPHTNPELPALGLEPLSPPPGGWGRLLAKRAQHSREMRLIDLIPVATCAASILIMVMAMRGPRIDVNEVRSQLTAQGTALRVTGNADVLVEQRAVAEGVRIYAVRRR